MKFWLWQFRSEIDCRILRLFIWDLLILSPCSATRWTFTLSTEINLWRIFLLKTSYIIVVGVLIVIIYYYTGLLFVSADFMIGRLVLSLFDLSHVWSCPPDQLYQILAVFIDLFRRYYEVSSCNHFIPLLCFWQSLFCPISTAGKTDQEIPPLLFRAMKMQLSSF